MKLFTVDEANALIPRLRDLFLEIRNTRKGLGALESRIQPAREKSVAGGGSPFGALFVQLVRNFSRIMGELEEMGVLLKDLDQGLFDFPHRLDDQVVLLCWKHGESEIDWYHDVDTGYAHRKRLPKGPEHLV